MDEPDRWEAEERRSSNGRWEACSHTFEACPVYTPFMLGSIFLVPDCMGITLATLAVAERFVALGDPLGPLLVESWGKATKQILCSLFKIWLFRQTFVETLQHFYIHQHWYTYRRPYSPHPTQVNRLWRHFKRFLWKYNLIWGRTRLAFYCK